MTRPADDKQTIRPTTAVAALAATRRASAPWEPSARRERQKEAPMTRPRAARTCLATLTLAALTATASACTPSPAPMPSPSPTPTVVETTTPTASPTLSERDQNIADAKDAYVAYITAYDAAAQAGFTDRDLTIAVFELTSADARDEIVSIQSAFEEHGLIQTGDTVVRSVVATEFQEDTTGSGMHRAGLRVCLDLSATDTLRDGVSTEPTDQYTGPRNVYVQMQRQSGGNWTVARENPRPEERC